MEAGDKLLRWLFMGRFMRMSSRRKKAEIDRSLHEQVVQEENILMLMSMCNIKHSVCFPKDIEVY